MLPPSFIIFEASFATSVNEKQEINILLKKFSLVVFRYSPDNSDLSENAIAWTTKSISPQLDFTSSNNFITSSFFSTSQLKVTFEFNFSANGTTLFFNASPSYVNASSAPASDSFCAIPQAIDLSLATPMINPFFPFIRLIDYTFSKTKVAFVPPKPKLLDIIALS